MVFPFYGTKTLCQEHGQLKYDTCGSETGGYEIDGFKLALLELMLEKNQLCAKLSASERPLYAPLSFDGSIFRSDKPYMSQSKIRMTLAELSDNKAPCLTEDDRSQSKIKRIGVP